MISFENSSTRLLSATAGQEDTSLVQSIHLDGVETAAMTLTNENGVLVWKLGQIRFFEDSVNSLLRLKFAEVTSQTDGTAVTTG